MLYKNKKTGFTLAEVLITLGVLGALFAITTPVLLSALPNFNTYKIKKINITFKDTVEFMLNKHIQYESKHDFSNAGYTMEGDDIVADKNTFKRIFIKIVDMKDKFECYAYGANRKIDCYVSVDNMVWAIPPSDFKTNERGSVIVTVKNKDGWATSDYVPITVYPNYKKKKADEDPDGYMKDNALFYGLRRDGKIIFFDDINCETNPKSMQCLAVKEVGSSKMKRR